MRVIRFQDESGVRQWGVPQGADLAQAQVIEGDLFGSYRVGGKVARVARLLAPVEPVNIFCIGANYAEHAREFGRQPPAQPIVFMKPTSSLNHPGGIVRVPACARPEGETDYEAELAVVIGKPTRNVTEEQALQYVLGYTCANDVTARHWQKEGGGGQWIRGKGFDTFCPLGPVLLTADEIPDPQNLAISTRLNGQVMQQDHTSNMIFSVRFLIAYLSRDTTLLPGTVILTGTTHGVGAARKPPVWMKPGDHVVVEIDRIGKLENTIAAAE